jgi:hypothetical protein
MITGKFTTKIESEKTFYIPDGYYVDEKDSKFRRLTFGEFGIDMDGGLCREWKLQVPTLDVYLPIKKIPIPKNITPRSLNIKTEDIYSSDIKIPEGYEQVDFDTLKNLHESGIQYFLTLSGQAYNVCCLDKENRVRIGLRKLDE